MNQATFIEDNRAVLTRIVAALIAMAGLADGGAILPQHLYRAVWRVLSPAESAVRRLIVIIARGLTVKLPPPRPMPKGLVRSREGSGRLSFQLFDTRKRFSPPRRTFVAGAGPCVHLFAASPLVPLFRPRPIETSTEEPNGECGAQHLHRRLAAIKKALENLPNQARRLVRWQARRDRMQSPAFRSPLRPGPPPGHRENPEEEIDRVLMRCHLLARQALNADTS